MSDVVGQPRPLNGLRGLVDLAHHAGRFLRGFHRQTQRLAYDAGGNRARRNTVDADAGFAEFHRDAFRQMNHGGLCGPVHHGGGKAGKPSRDAAIVDDAAGALATHMRGGVLHAEHDTAHQCRHGGIELWDFQPFNAAGLCGPAGIIKQAIDAAEFLNRTADQRAHLPLDGDIGAPENTVGAELFRESFAFRRAPPGDHDPGAFGNEYFRGAQTDAAGRAGDHSDLAVEPFHLGLLRGRRRYHLRTFGTTQSVARFAFGNFSPRFALPVRSSTYPAALKLFWAGPPADVM